MRKLIALMLLIVMGVSSAVAVPTRNAANRPAFQDAPNIFIGDTNDFYFDGVMTDPLAPLATQGATTGGSCSVSNTYRIYVAYKNATGETDLSPPSIEFKPAAFTTNKITVTIPATRMPDNANTWSAWFSSSADAHATIRACSTGGAIEDVSASTLTATCLCSTTTDASEPTTNTTQEVYALRVATNPSEVSVTMPSRNQVDICAVGCKYKTLGDACSAETSTATAPIVYYLHAGVYSSSTATSCAGEDYATITGDGPSTRLINTSTAAGDFGALEMGNSTNVTIQNFYIKGHRALWFDGTGGEIVVRNMWLEADSSQSDNDCAFYKSQPTGSVRRDTNVVCLANVDGFTQGVVTPPFSWYSTNNVVTYTASSPGSNGAWTVGGIPDYFSSIGDRINYTSGTAAAGGIGMRGFYFAGDLGGCTSGCVANVQGANIFMSNTDTGTDSPFVRGFDVGGSATELAALNILDTNVNVTTTAATNGVTNGVIVQNANTTTVVNVIGGKWRSSGGTSNIDFDGASGASNIVVYTADYETATNGETSIGNVRQIKAGVQAAFGDGTPSSVAAVNIASSNVATLLMENTDAVNSENSGTITMCNSVAAGNQCYSVFNRGADDKFVLYETTAGQSLAEWTKDATGELVLAQARVRVGYHAAGTPTFGGAIVLGGGVDSDTNNYVQFDAATNDSSMIWVQSIKNLNLSGVEQLEIDCVTTMPTCNTAGRIVCDGDGTVGLCFCNGSAYVAFGGAADCA